LGNHNSFALYASPYVSDDNKPHFLISAVSVIMLFILLNKQKIVLLKLPFCSKIFEHHS
ncbi:hypothetical protein T4B_4134, partial [Trichinella pseudospiralis]